MCLAVGLTRFFIAFLIFGTFVSAGASAQEKSSDDPDMEFVIVRSQDCSQNCLEWISAEGTITAGSPVRFKKVLKSLKGRRLPVVFHSPGGSVSGAYEIGRMIRKAGLETAVGGTHLKGCPDNDPRCRKEIARNGTAIGVSYILGARCYSACPLAFAGGIERSSSNWSALGVHQFTAVYNTVRVTVLIKYKIVNGKKVEVSRKEVKRKTIGQHTEEGLTEESAERLAVYLKEMNVDRELVDYVRGTTPKRIWVISPERALEMKLITHEIVGEEKPGMPKCAADAADDTPCHSRVKPADPNMVKAERATI